MFVNIPTISFRGNVKYLGIIMMINLRHYLFSVESAYRFVKRRKDKPYQFNYYGST